MSGFFSRALSLVVLGVAALVMPAAQAAPAEGKLVQAGLGGHRRAAAAVKGDGEAAVGQAEGQADEQCRHQHGDDDGRYPAGTRGR